MHDSSSYDRFARVQEVFARAIELPHGEQISFVTDACADDAELRSEVISLLQHDTTASGEFLKVPDVPDDVRHGDFVDESDGLIGMRVGRYHVKRIIASGGMGNVFEAVQEQPERVVALKVMRRSVNSRSALQRFQLESQILGRLRHPNIAHVYEAGIHDGESGRWPFFAMELVPGATPIVEFVEREKLETNDRLRLFANVCDAAHHGHQKGVIHRDLKPSNILIDAEGDPKIIDFGVARATDADTTLQTQHTATGQLVGTIRYMSPEQCGDESNDIDTRSDVYSLGVVLYEVLSGASPYEVSGTSLFRAARTIREEPPRPLGMFDRRFRGDVETIVLKALEKDRERRYQSASDLASDIRRFINRDPIEARPPTVWTRSTHWMARHPFVTTTFGCVVISTAILASALLATWYVTRSPFRIDVSPDGATAYLYSATASVLQKWGAGIDRGIEMAELLDRPSELGGGKLAILGFARTAGGDYEDELYAFDMRGDLGTPLWSSQFSQKDYPPSVLASADGQHNINFSTGLVADVFPALPGEEIVAVHHVNSGSLCVIRVYDLRGQVLYQMWHRGAIASCHWMPDAGLLALAGRNSEAWWEARGVDDLPGEHPIVVFAIRPTAGTRRRDFLSASQGDGVSSPVWYKCLLPPKSASALDSYFFRTVPGRAVGSEVEFYLLEDRESEAAVSWRLDAEGQRVPDSLSLNDVYRRRKGTTSTSLHLGALPPIVARPAKSNKDAEATSGSGP